MVPVSFFVVPFQSRLLLHEFIKRSLSLDDLADGRVSWLQETEWHALHRVLWECDSPDRLPIGASERIRVWFTRVGRVESGL